MIAVDTNIIVRFLTRDDEEQHALAEKLFNSERIFVPDTVLLETEWVLRYSYSFSRDETILAFKKLVGLENVYVSDPEMLARAIEWHEKGLDFADAMHLSSSRHLKSFVTFDRKFVNKSKGLSACEVVSA